MAKVKIEGLDKVQRKFNRNLKIQINKLFRDEELRKKVGTIIIRDIKENYVSKKPPKEGTLKWREKYDKINKTDPAYSRDKIKAVFTGELLEDLKNNVKGFPTEKRFEIAHSDKKHSKYQGITQKIGSESTYKEISKGLVEKFGHNYFKLTEEAQKEIAELIRQAIFKLMRTLS